MDHDSCKEMITKLLSNQDIRRCVQEVLIETGLSQCVAPILFQAKFKQVPVSWSDCIQPYPVDELAFNKHHQGKTWESGAQDILIQIRIQHVEH
jgi:hypothetical protein